MGTETQRLQREIKGLIKQLGWSQKRFARELQAMDEDGDWSTERETCQFEERVKKHLTRPTVSPELLGRYLQQLQGHGDFAKLNVTVPYFANHRGFSEDLVEGMRRISAMLDEPSLDSNVSSISVARPKPRKA